jgi:hypothetical protein
MFSEIAEVTVAGLARKKGVFLENILGFQMQQSCIGFDVFFSPSVSISKHGDHLHTFPPDELDK